MKFWQKIIRRITKRIYYKYLIPLLSIMAIAMLLGGLLIVILVSNNIDKTGNDVKTQTKADLLQDIQFRHNAHTQVASNQFQHQLDHITEKLFTLSKSRVFKRLQYRKMHDKVEQLMNEVPEILEFKVLRSNGYSTYAHCNPDLLYSVDLKSLRPVKIFDTHDIPFKNVFISKAYFSAEEKKQYVYIGLPLLNTGRRIKYGLMVRYDLAPTLEQLKKTANNVGGGDMYIVDKEDHLIAQSWKKITDERQKQLGEQEKKLMTKQLEGNFWEDKLFSFHKNKYGFTTILDTPNKLAYNPVNKRLASLSEQFDSTTYSILFFVTLAFLTIAALATYIGVRVARSITRPVILMKRATQKVAHGNLNVQIPATTHDELGELSASFNQMIAAIKDYRKKIQEHSQQAEVQAQKLAESNANLEQYARTVSHDLKEPLRMISSYIQLLQRRYNHLFDEDANEYMNFTLDGAKRMGQIIEDLLAYARFEEKAQHKMFQIIDLNEMLKAALHNLKWMIQENNATISYDELPSIKGKKTYMLQLFQNLLSNAIKYRRDETPQINISTNVSNGQFIIKIEDNGSGMASEDLERIFMPFTRLVSRQEIEGNGIGLATVKKIVTHHGGEIWAESELGKGSTFYIALPTSSVQVPIKAVA